MKQFIILITCFLLSNYAYSQLSIIGPTQTCPGSTYTYTANLSGGTGGIGVGNYIWFLNNNNVGSGVSVNITVPSGESAHVLTVNYVERGNPSASGSATIYLYNPFAGIVNLNSNSTICYGESATVSVGLQRLGTNGSGNFQKRNGGLWQDISYPGTSVTVSNLTSTTDFRFKITNSCGTQYSNIVSVTVRPTLNPGSINGTKTICYNSSAGTLGNASTPTGGDNSYSYQWQVSTSSGGSYSNISGANAASYSPGDLSATRYYRRRVSSCGETKYSNIVSVTVRPALNPGSINGTKTICHNSSAGTLGNASTPTGGDNSYSYQWQVSTSSGGSYNNISGANAASYNPGNLTATRYYRRRVSSCGETRYSNIVSVTVRPTLNPGSINGTKFICYNTTAGTLGNASSATGGDNNYTYQWQVSSSSGGSYNDISGATSTTYSPGSLTATRYYRRRVVSCGETKYSNMVTVTVDNQIQVSAGNSFSIYQFEGDRSLVNTGESPSGGAFSGANVSNNTFNAAQSGHGSKTVTYTYTNSNGCSAFATKSITVKQNPEISVNGTNDIVWGENRILSVPSGFNSYQWYRNGEIISGATSRTYTVESVGEYHVLITLASGASFSVASATFINKASQQNENMVQTVVYKTAMKDGNAIRSIREGNSQITFFDGLGRQVQTIMMQASPQEHDLVAPVEYDARGNISKKYLPYEEDQKDGILVTNALRSASGSYSESQQYQFYSNSSSDKIAATNYPYQEVVYEKSPLKRPLAEYSAGEAWAKEGALGGKPVITEYLINQSGDNVMKFEVVNDQLEKNGFYEENSLEKIVSTDENGNKRVSFINIFGQTILQRKYNSPTEYFDTYSVYDRRGNVKFVLPPMASIAFAGNLSASEKEEIMNDFVFQYTYDGRNRKITQKLPGVDTVYMVYDNYDRLILTQDGEQRLESLYHFTKYDAMGRVVLTGLVQLTGPIAVIRENVKNTSPAKGLGTPYNTYESRTATGGIFGYTNEAYPGISANDVLTVSYYDDYSFKSLNWFDDSIFDYEDQQIANEFELTEFVKGQVTGGLTRVLNTSEMLASVNYYDSRYRLVQNISESLDNRMIRLTNGYDFVGNITLSQSEYLLGAESYTITESFEYDHMDRLLKKTHQIDGGNPIVMVENEYNKLGELITKKLHKESSSPGGTQGGEYAQSVDYRYNSRGWITRINHADLSADNSGDKPDYFGMELGYTDDLGLASAPQYNGNIAAMKWSNNQGLGEVMSMNGVDIVSQRGYSFAYDGLNRLKNAQSHEKLTAFSTSASYNVNINQYDANGNIIELSRTDHNGDPLDVLTYSYENSNQLRKVLDTGDKTKGFKDSNADNTDYTYDENGNMKTDGNKGITDIHYNYLNLADTVKFSNGNTMIFTYDATGNKLSQEVISDSLHYTTAYLGALFLKNDTLQFINTAEGRVVPKDSGWEYQYYLKDHLGNVRTTFTTKPETEVFETSFETASVPEAYFDNYDEQNRDMSYSRTGTHSSRLSSTDSQLIGLAKSLKVYPGDTVSATAYVRELAGTGGNINNLFTMLAQGFAGAFANTPIGLEGNLNSFSESLYPAAGIGGLMDKDDSDATPKLYLNMLYFDKDMNFITASFARSSSAATIGFEELSLEVLAQQEGYILIYVSNEEEQANIAYFDDVNVTHKHSAVIQEESYYPFGMSQHYSYQRELTKEQRYTYNGKESITDLDLGWLDFGARMYQADLGRWFNVDPMAEKYLDMTPYKYGLNNPVAYTDPTGMTEVYGVEMDLGATGSVTSVFDASPDVVENGTRYESMDDFIEQATMDYYAGLRENLSSSDQDAVLGEFATGFTKALSSIARYDAFIQWVREEKPHYIDPKTDMPRKNLVPNTYDLSQHIPSGAEKIEGKLNTKGNVVAEFYYTMKNGHLVDGMKLYDNLNTYGQGQSGPAIALTGGTSEIAYVFFNSIKARSTFLDNYYYDRKAIYLENFRKR